MGTRNTSEIELADIHHHFRLRSICTLHTALPDRAGRQRIKRVANKDVRLRFQKPSQLPTQHLMAENDPQGV